jgi:hypothetical protein
LSCTQARLEQTNDGWGIFFYNNLYSGLRAQDNPISVCDMASDQGNRFIVNHMTHSTRHDDALAPIWVPYQIANTRDQVLADVVPWPPSDDIAAALRLGPNCGYGILLGCLPLP